MAMIDFGVQSSGDESSKVINEPWNDLLEIFYDDPEMAGYFTNLDDFQIVFRVSGKSTDFEGNGPEFLKVILGGKTISIDFTIPEEKWRNSSIKVFRQYISSGVKECFQLLKQKAIELNKINNIEKLEKDFKKGMTRFENCL